MRPIADRLASARRGASALAASLALLLTVSAATAGDRAGIDTIGFSPDGRYFAFEEFGITDGAGFAYSSIFLIDLTQDRWVAGTPIRARTEDEAVTLSAMREQALAEARGELARLDISVPSETLALLGDGVADTAGKTLRFGVPGYAAGTVLDPQTLQLRTVPLASDTPCTEWFGSEPLGFELTLSDDAGERVLHSDTALPDSRGCPLDYRLYGVVTPFYAQTIDQAVAIVSVYPGGFEGPDRRFFAVPLGR